MRLSNSTSATFTEATDHFADHTDEPVSYPQDAFLRHLLVGYVEEHEEDFSKKEPIEEGGPAHWIYVSKGSNSEKNELDGNDDESDEDEASNENGCDTDGELTFTLSDGPDETGDDADD